MILFIIPSLICFIIAIIVIKLIDRYLATVEDIQNEPIYHFTNGFITIIMFGCVLFGVMAAS